MKKKRGACTKQRYPSFKDAQAGAAMYAKRNKRAALFAAYYCERCAAFHFGRTGGINWALVSKNTTP